MGADMTQALELVREESGLHLHWQGRKTYRSKMPTPRVLEYQENLSFQPDDGDNLVVEGDNLQVMASLRSQYADSFDVVYIDPPYNRGGNDFRYSDARFEDPDADASDARYIGNTDGGRHTKWLNYMAPRLAVLKSLMADHGVLFISISDIELGRLTMLLDEIFDEGNRLGILTWRGSTDNNPSRIQTEHEYILCYAKNSSALPKVWTTPDDDARDMMLEHFEELKNTTGGELELAQQWATFVRVNESALGRLKAYTRVDDRGPYQAARRVHNPNPGGYRYGVSEEGIVADGAVNSYATPMMGYRLKPESMDKLIREGKIVFPARRSQIVQMKDYLQDYRGTLRSVIEIDARAGTRRLRELFGQEFAEFRYAKPTELIELLIGAAGSKDALVLDVFAGSGTTGDAVVRLNARDGGARKFVLVEEGNEQDKYARTLLAPRLRRAIQIEGVSTGFSFYSAGRQIDRAALLDLEREHIAAVICQTDRSGSKSGVRRITGQATIIGASQKNQAIALVWDGAAASKVDASRINEALEEAAALQLALPLRIYGTTCTVSETRSFVFCQIPDEILIALNVAENALHEDDVAPDVERIE